MPLFRRRASGEQTPPVDPAEVTALRDELARLRADVAALSIVREPAPPAPVAPLPPATPTPPPPTRLVPPTPGTSLDDLRAELGALAAQLSSSSADTEQLRTLTASVGARLDGLAAELAHQIDELAGEVEAIHARVAAAATVTPEALEALRMGQVRLANEQARYEIAFRQDLAQLADELRRPKA